MATWADVERLALALPRTARRTSYGNAAVAVADRTFVWERPLRGRERDPLGAAAPEGTVLGARVADLGVKDALIADDPAVFFTIPHFDGHPSVLMRLERIGPDVLEEVVVDAWLARAPARAAAAYRAG